MKYLIIFVVVGAFAVSAFGQMEFVFDQPPSAAQMTDILSRAIPGVSYPIYATIPFTNFTCAGKIPGFYADIESDCQVFRRCDKSGQMFSELCPNMTTYNQLTLTCDWFFNVDCPAQIKYANTVNERLYTNQPLLTTAQLAGMEQGVAYAAPLNQSLQPRSQILAVTNAENNQTANESSPVLTPSVRQVIFIPRPALTLERYAMQEPFGQAPSDVPLETYQPDGSSVLLKGAALSVSGQGYTYVPVWQPGGFVQSEIQPIKQEATPLPVQSQTTALPNQSNETSQATPIQSETSTVELLAKTTPRPITSSGFIPTIVKAGAMVPQNIQPAEGSGLKLINGQQYVLLPLAWAQSVNATEPQILANAAGSEMVGDELYVWVPVSVAQLGVNSVSGATTIVQSPGTIETIAVMPAVLNQGVTSQSLTNNATNSIPPSLTTTGQPVNLNATLGSF